MEARVGALGDSDPVAVAADVLLDDDAGGTFGHRRAGEYADGLAKADAAGKGAAGGGLSDHGEAVAGCGGALQRVAVHRRGRKGRLVGAGGDGGAHPAPGGLRQRHILGGGRSGKGKDPGLCLFHRNHHVAS